MMTALILILLTAATTLAGWLLIIALALLVEWCENRSL
jgi:hypothetical protein